MTAAPFFSSLRCIDGPSGAVLHALKRSATGFAGFGEAYFSEVHEGAIKCWRRHHRVTLNLVVPVGFVRFVVHDEKPANADVGQFSEFRLGRAAEVYGRLTVPPGLWFAFQGLGPGTSLILSIIDEEHESAEAEQRELSSLAYGW